MKETIEIILDTEKKAQARIRQAEKQSQELITQAQKEAQRITLDTEREGLLLKQKALQEQKELFLKEKNDILSNIQEEIKSKYSKKEDVINALAQKIFFQITKTYI